MCGATWGYRLRTVTMPLLKPGLVAAWLLLFIASVPRARRVHPADGAEVQGDHAGHRRVVVLDQLGAHGGHGALPDAGGGRRGLASCSRCPPRVQAGWRVSVSQASIEARDLGRALRRGRRGPWRTFTVPPASSHAARPSGCGKTTTLRAIAGLERPTSGDPDRRHAGVSSSPIREHSPSAGLSMVFQSYAIWPHMTVFDNVAYGLRVRSAGPRARTRCGTRSIWCSWAIARAVRFKLSGGQQQRVALARAFAFSPCVLLLPGEPLSNLDAKLRSECGWARELQRRLSVTSLYVTHDLEEALAMSDRIVVMQAA